MDSKQNSDEQVGEKLARSPPRTDETKRCVGLPVSHQMVNERDTGDRVTNTTNQITRKQPVHVGGQRWEANVLLRV